MRRADTLPVRAKCYRTIGPFDAATLPAGLRRTHNLRHGCWGVLTLQSGSFTMVWEDANGGRQHLEAPAKLVIPPQADHHVEGEGPFELTVAFHRVPITDSAGDRG